MVLLVCNMPILHPFNIFFKNFSFSPKLYFSFFLSGFEMGEKKSLNSGVIEIKQRLITILTIKIINFGVYEFY